jgi:hypothetical protein
MLIAPFKNASFAFGYSAFAIEIAPYFFDKTIYNMIGVPILINALVADIAYPSFNENAAPLIVEVVTTSPLLPRYKDCSGVQVHDGLVIEPKVTVSPELSKIPKILST